MTAWDPEQRWYVNLPARDDVAKVLIMKWSAMGDLALSSAAFEDVHRALPGVRLHLDTLPRYAGLFAHDPRFEQVLGIDVRSPWLAGMVRWLARVGAARYDAIIDLQSSDRSRVFIAALVCSGRAPQIRVGNHRHWPYTVAPVTPPPEVHALDHLRASLNAAGIASVSPQPVLHPGPKHRERAAALLSRHDLAAGDFALFMPGCQVGARLKRWGWRRFAALALALARRGVGKVALVGADDEREECDAIADACPGITVNVCGETALLDLVPLAQAARLVVANDTGTAHVAAAAGRPMVVLCGPTDPRRVRPAGAAVRTLQSGLWCCNCYRKDCTHHSCMEVLSPERVLTELEATGALT